MIDLTEGVPGVDGPSPRNFEEFWPYYVSQHLHPLTRAVHVAGTLGAFATGALALGRRSARLAAVAPIVGYGPAWVSHFAVERNRPATFGSPLWSLRADLRQVGRALTGRLGGDVAGVREALRMSPAERTLAERTAA